MTALFILAFALAMDAFAVSVVRGSARGRHTSEGIKLGLAFGAAQGVMPLFGWGLGLAFSEPFKRIDHWIAFALLAFLGLRLLWEGLKGADDDEEPSGPSKGSVGLSLLVSAFATSIDAAAAGVTLPLLGVAVPIACFVIGATTGLICMLGYMVGSKVSSLAGKRAEVVGGVVLVGLGVKILVEHLSA